MKQEEIEAFLKMIRERSTPIQIVVAGSRDWNDYPVFRNTITEILKNFPDVEFISGKASKGPDNMIIQYAKDYGFICHEYPADWNNIGVPNARIKMKNGRQYNANAGHIRNQLMAEKADFYIIFWDGKSPGTKDMISRCEDNIKHGFLIMV